MIVGPAHCRHCSRAIYPAPCGWTHGQPRGGEYCYAPSGERRSAEPYPNAAARSELEHRADDAPVTAADITSLTPGENVGCWTIHYADGTSDHNVPRQHLPIVAQDALADRGAWWWASSNAAASSELEQ